MQSLGHSMSSSGRSREHFWRQHSTHLTGGKWVPVALPGPHLVCLVQGLLPEVQLLIQVAFLLAEQLLVHREVQSVLCLPSLPSCSSPPPRSHTFSFSRSSIFCCSADSVTSICWSHCAHKESRAEAEAGDCWGTRPQAAVSPHWKFRVHLCTANMQLASLIDRGRMEPTVTPSPIRIGDGKKTLVPSLPFARQHFPN